MSAIKSRKFTARKNRNKDSKSYQPEPAAVKEPEVRAAPAKTAGNEGISPEILARSRYIGHEIRRSLIAGGITFALLIALYFILR